MKEVDVSAEALFQFEATVAAAAAGDETALAAVIAKLLPSIRVYARRAVYAGLDQDDATQEGLIGLLSALKTYQPGHEVAFEAYARLCIRRAIFSARRKAAAKKQAPLAGYLPIEGETIAADPAEITIQREQLERTLANIRTRLSPMEKQVLQLALMGYSYRQVAVHLGLPVKMVDNAMQRARKKLKT
ncbi:sigma-70 family RNA polymerase sigma factor [Ruminococcaceae bacterium OttesenSCG-928-N02]|nr:sigma-70 family RNA polymerase sigma factor [Ruminococcaceae bacterium OttesenSCG-928-N02]